ncbi:MAG: SsrA-binding protein [Chlamydiales bacterium]|jgi:SsrA-binding protein|nr:SsrA-binding protein [Chlamydiales bacterium]
MSRTSSELASNRKAGYSFEILETFEAGIALLGTEVKSLRTGGGSLQEAYLYVDQGELWLINAHIAPYRFGNIYNHEERRKRKLLMHKREIAKLLGSQQEKGFALIPLSLYLKEGRVKVKVAVAKGKKIFDKREAIKERDVRRTMDLAKKGMHD